jgi:large subunit ribosomal protein L7/L12
MHNTIEFNRLLTDARLRARALAMAIRSHFSTSSADDAAVLEMLANDYGRSLDELQDASATFTVVLAAIGEKKIDVIKEVRAFTGSGLKEVKELVEAAPTIIEQGVAEAEANSIKQTLESVGATVMLI